MFTPPDGPPQGVEELEKRARDLAGFKLAELADAMSIEVPESLKNAKGWVGTLIEHALGANAGNLPVPDFTELRIELKTLPVDRSGAPFESTYVAMVPLKEIEGATWEQSSVCHKLEHVLWVPILAEQELSIGERLVGRSVLWKPDEDQLAKIRADWELHLETIREGYVDAISGRDGDVLQIRPKGADGRSRTWTTDEHGADVMTKPRGFYLRASFTAEIIRKSLET